MEHKLRTLKVALGYDCNLRCGFCLQQDEDKSVALSDDDINVIFEDDSVRDDVKLIVITGGEPLHEPYFEKTLQIVKKASKWHKETCIFTNGTLLNEIVAVMFKKAGLTRFRVSLYDPIDWQWVSEIMERLKVYGFPMMAKYTVTKENWDNLGDVLGRVIRSGIEWFQIKPYNRIEVPEVDEKYELSPEQVLLMSKLLFTFKTTAEKKGMRVDLLPLCYEFLVDDTLTVDDLSTCHCGQSEKGYLVIDPNCDVKICGAYPTALGNIRVDNLSTIWREHELLKMMREKTQPEECEDCGHWEKCNATDCHSATYAKYGNFDHANPQCPIAKERTEKPHIEIDGKVLGSLHETMD